MVGQYGTHIDAPIHFVEGGRWLDEIDLKDFLLPLYVIDKSKEVAANPNFILSKQDILDFEAEYGQIAEGAFVAFRSDWSKRWPDQDAMRNLDENGVQQSPGWSREALEFLIHERHVRLWVMKPSILMQVFQQQSMAWSMNTTFGTKYLPS